MQRLVGHWGTTPGLNFVYAHLNRVIRVRDLEMIYIMGPGHDGPGPMAAAWLEGTYSEIYPNVSQDEPGMATLFRQFSFPGGIPSHVAAEVPGSIHEGGELGYALSHAYGAAFDNPELIVAAVVGDGEAEAGPLATSWHSTKFVNPARDGTVLPILHLNGYKIGSATVLARLDDDELDALLRGYGHTPYDVTGEDPAQMHRDFARALDGCLDEIQAIKVRARAGSADRPRWPMIVLRSPKGWTGPAEVDGQRIEDSWRSHQVPFTGAREDEGHRQVLEDWLRSYRPEELFDDDGAPVPAIRDLHPAGDQRMSASPHANGGTLLRDLRMPDFRDYAVAVDAPGTGAVEATRVLGEMLRDVITANPENFRLFAPDENNSNRLSDVLEVTTRAWNAATGPEDEHLGRDGRLMEILSEHTCQGWLEGYLLTGRHGLFSCYVAFVHIVDSMFNQHAKWLHTSGRLPWRRPVASLNYLLTSHVWRQDHNGFTHQDPGFIDHVLNKKPEIVRVYLPPDANTLLSVADHCLRSRHDVNVIVAGKQPALQYLDMDAAENPHGLSHRDFDALFTTDKPVIFAYHGYPWLIHRLTYRRTIRGDLHVHGYQEEGTTTTHFDMCVMNQVDRFTLAIDVIDRVPRLNGRSAHVREQLRNRLVAHRQYVYTHGEDLPEVREWEWTAAPAPVHHRRDENREEPV